MLMPHSINHGNACFAYFNKIWGIPFRFINPNIKLCHCPWTVRMPEWGSHLALEALPACTGAPRGGQCGTANKTLR
jgi:hypothetical protein